MGIGELTDRKAVLQAIAEYDRIGQIAFLNKYSFGEAKRYFLVHDNRRYDSKALIGAAYGFQFPANGPLRRTEFTGGEKGVATKLRQLGFEVVAIGPEANKPAFLMTWKDGHWPLSKVMELVKKVEETGQATEQWRIAAHAQSYRGARVWLLKQGLGTKGIFGVGIIVGDPVHIEKPEGENDVQVMVRFHRLVNPMSDLLISEHDLRQFIPATKLATQSSGITITSSQSLRLEAVLPGNRWKQDAIDPTVADDEPFNPGNIGDARKFVIRTIAARRGQRQFRNALLGAYQRRCAVTGCEIIDILEAAHIHPYLGDESNRIANGLLLRSDIHTLFDCGLLTVDHLSMTVRLAPELHNSSFKKLAGRTIRKTKSLASAPSVKALEWRNSQLIWF